MKIKCHIDTALLVLDEKELFEIFGKDEIGFCGTCNEWYFGFNKCPCKMKPQKKGK